MRVRFMRVDLTGHAEEIARLEVDITHSGVRKAPPQQTDTCADGRRCS
jgi:hypothetical protein